MTRILRLLMIAAVAWPLWQPAAAQEAAVVNDGTRFAGGVLEKKEFSKLKVMPSEALNAEAEATDVEKAEANVNAEKPLGKWKFKTRTVEHQSSSIRVTKSRAAIPEGYASITLAAGNVWNDGSGYQMLLDADHNTYGSIIPATGALTTSGDVPASTYAEFEYKIPENADGALTTTNIILDGQATILVPAGTYDWCITNPTPEDRMWIASEQGDVQGRYDNYVFEAGLSYVFTVTLVGQNDNLAIEITNPDYSNPTNLTASDILDFEAMLTWTAGGDETSWNVEYKKKTDFDWISAGTATSTSYLLNNLSMATDYQARVQGVYANGLSGWALVSFTTDNDPAELCEPEEMGEISYSMSDSYGDGWNGASIQIVDAETDLVITTLTISSGSSASGTVSLCYGRTVNFVWTAGSYASECSFTITDPDGEVIASKTTSQTITDGSTFATYTMPKPGQTESLDFGTVDVGSSKTLIAKIMNDGSAAVQATLTATAPFSVSVASSTVTLQPGLNAVNVTFTPTEARNYHGTLTVAIGGETSTVTLYGTGNMSGPEAVRDEAFFEGITYTWADDEGTHTSNMTEVATKPEQIIALLKEVYTNQNIPGNLKRGYTATGGTDTYSDVSYPGIGSITRASGGTYSYSDDFGWNIPNKTSFKNTTSGNYTFTYMDPTDYKPNVEGLTLLLMESADDYDMATYEWPSSSLSNEEYLKSLVGTTIKSARVVTQAKRAGEGLDRGTLFKIDCDKMNKFFLLGKGQLRWDFDSYWAASSDGQYILGSEACPEPCYIYRRNSDYNGYHDEIYTPLFSHMYEQFSPVSLNTGANIDDLYQSLVNMQSFGVYHDCLTVPFAYTSGEPEGERHGHQFMMYGLDSEAADCQDVRDLMFFVPDYRMMKDDGRDPVEDYQKFVNYNTDRQPQMGLFVIKQNPITGEQIDGQDTYRLHLTWTSNLLSFLPDEDGQYTLYRVITNADGTKTYQAVGEFDPNTFEYYDNVPMLQTGQQVTYVVRGQDVDQFLSLQMSNEESFIIPGLDPSEIVLLEDATHYSRFDAQRVRNCYSNKLTMKNDLNGIKQANLTSSTQLTITRQAQGATEPTTIATVTFDTSNHGYTVQMEAQAADETEFPECADHSRAGYHANNGGTVKGNGSWTGTYTENTNGTINLGTLEIFDNFVQAIPSDNSHPNGYFYNVTSNYECDNNQPTAVYLNPGVTSTGDEIWYAWTWNNDNDGKWLLGTPQAGGILKFGPAKNNIIFARMNPAASDVPAFNYDGTCWNRTGDLSTVGYMGKTFTLNGWEMTGYWAGDVIYDQAHSNTFRIPVYKTSSQINGVFSQSDVDGDTNGQLGVPENVEFGVGVQLSSKSEILRYDTYRWNEGAPRYSVASADGDDEQDLPPQGLAMNQGEYYTISMNPDTNNETNGETSVSSGSGTATFVDEVPNESVNAAAYVYAPIIEVMSGRGDYNTYGGPLQTAAVGILDAEKDNAPKPMSSYSWTKTVNGETKKYAYYNVQFVVNTKSVPTGYEIYKIRAWRQIDDPSLLDEEYSVYNYRKGDENGKYMFEEIEFGTEAMDEFVNNNYRLGSGDDTKVVTGANGVATSYDCTLGTFGAQKLRTEGDDEQGVIDELNLNFKVRLYFTRTANLSDSKGVAEGKDDKFYIVEQEIPVQIKSGGTITGVESLVTTNEVVGMKYYNPAGIESDTPFKGVNIVVTRYSDGSTTTTKILK